MSSILSYIKPKLQYDELVEDEEVCKQICLDKLAILLDKFDNNVIHLTIFDSIDITKTIRHKTPYRWLSKCLGKKIEGDCYMIGDIETGYTLTSIGLFVGQVKYLYDDMLRYGIYTATTGTPYIYIGAMNRYYSKNGFGMIRFNNGNQYIGNWKTSTKNGSGTYTYADGHSWTGTWINDIPEKVLECVNPNLKKILEQAQCTRMISNKDNFYGQVLSKCLYCHPANTAELSNYLCSSCITNCHNNLLRHGTVQTKQSVIWTNGMLTCSCNCEIK